MRLPLFLMAAASVLAVDSAKAKDNAKPLRIIPNTTAGDISDNLARMLAEELQRSTGRTRRWWSAQRSA